MKVVAKILLINKAGQILVLRRGMTHPNFPGHLDFPGGEVDADEEPLKAVVREVKEETGLTVNDDDVHLLFDKDNNGTRHLLYMSNMPDSSIPVKLSWEHDAHTWLSQNELCGKKLQSNFDAYYRDVINHLTSPGRNTIERIVKGLG